VGFAGPGLDGPEPFLPGGVGVLHVIGSTSFLPEISLSLLPFIVSRHFPFQLAIRQSSSLVALGTKDIPLAPGCQADSSAPLAAHSVHVPRFGTQNLPSRYPSKPANSRRRQYYPPCPSPPACIVHLQPRARRSRAMRPRMAANRSLDTATSAS